MILDAPERPAADKGEAPSGASERDWDSGPSDLSSEDEAQKFDDSESCDAPYEGWGSYRPGRQCPLELGAVIHERYRILDKSKTFSDCISWIARDHKTSEIVQLDIYTARRSEGVAKSDDSKYYKQFLEKRDPSKPCYFQSVVDELWIDSLNGRHLCRVLELGVLEIYDLVTTERNCFTAAGCRDILHTLLQGLCELHDQGLAVNCLNIDNLMYTSVEANTFSDQELRQVLGNPRVKVLETRRTGHNTPNTSTAPTSLDPFLKIGRRPRLEAFPPILKIGDSSPRKYPRDNEDFAVYTPPEVYCEEDKIPTAAEDIWRAACAIFEIVTAEELFYFGMDSPRYFCQMQDTLGPIPDRLRRELGIDPEFVRRYARFAPFLSRYREEDPLSKRIRKRHCAVVSEKTSLEDSLPLFTDEEYDLLTDLLREMLEYDPSKRITAKEALKHPFFNFQGS